MYEEEKCECGKSVTESRLPHLQHLLYQSELG
jgi:hypothetical protein